MLETVINAIRERSMVYLDYPPGMRLIEPHAVGYGGRGQLLMRAFQIDGASSSGDRRGWKLFELDRAATLGRAGMVFDGPEAGYRRGDRAMTRGVIVEL
ncbi:hypothetical protein [Methylopila sp. 73B]|uniref:hypothetical protein n=1 Tax=Methylopila sp. 73B TaxID=1120792 RepID=UPI0018CC161F|nr:hypothetical protein [Methylopila sp. 73B]